jgi:hypothetical protein
MLIGTEVTLSEVEQKIARFIAKSRFQNNRNQLVNNSKIGDQSDELTDLEGVAGEVAFCKLFNLYPDFSIQVRASCDDKADANLCGLLIDVKTTMYRSGKLLAAIWKTDSKADVFALMTGEFPNYVFCGFMDRTELLRPERIGNLGHGDTYIAEQIELFPYPFQ